MSSTAGGPWLWTLPVSYSPAARLWSCIRCVVLVCARQQAACVSSNVAWMQMHQAASEWQQPASALAERCVLLTACKEVGACYVSLESSAIMFVHACTCAPVLRLSPPPSPPPHLPHRLTGQGCCSHQAQGWGPFGGVHVSTHQALPPPVRYACYSRISCSARVRYHSRTAAARYALPAVADLNMQWSVS